MKLLALSLLAAVVPLAGARSLSTTTPPQQPLADKAIEQASRSPASYNLYGEDKTDKDALLSLHRSLVSIESISGNEHAVGKFIAAHLEALNYTVELQPIDPLPQSIRQASSSSNGGGKDAFADPGWSSENGKEDEGDGEQTPPQRYNVYAYPAGGDRQTRVLLTTHMDTVPPFINYTRSSGSDSDEIEVNAVGADTIRGRGTNDAKGSLAAQIRALTELLASDAISPSDCGLLFVVGEEVGGDGMRRANDLGLNRDTQKEATEDPESKPTDIKGWETVIFGEPTEGKLAAGHKGILGLTLVARGKAAHSGYPWLGRSAVSELLPALVALDGLGARLPSSEKYGATTVNIGRIEGGVAMNVVPVLARAKVSFRLAGGTWDEAKAVTEEAIRAAYEGKKMTAGEAATVVTSTVVVDGFDGTDGARERRQEEEERDGAEAEAAWPSSVVVELQFAARGYGPVDCDADVPGFDTITVNYGTDVPLLRGDHKCYLYGPGSILVAHGDDENVKVDDLVRAVGDYKRLVLTALGKKAE